MEPVILSNTASTFSDIEQEAYIKRWTPKVQRALRSAVRPLSKGKTESFVLRKNRSEQKLTPSIVGKPKRQAGVIDLIQFTFERHGVFVHKGVSRGYQMAGNFVIRTAQGPVSAPRNPYEWFNPVLDIYLPQLADKIAQINANAALSSAKLKIN